MHALDLDSLGAVQDSADDTAHHEIRPQ
jgi:hypothetical protein